MADETKTISADPNDTGADSNSIVTSSDFIQGGSKDTYGDLSSSTLQLAYPASDEGGSSLDHFYPLDGSSGATDQAGSNDGSVDGVTLDQSGLLGRTDGSGDGTDDIVTFSKTSFTNSLTKTYAIYINNYTESSENDALFGQVSSQGGFGTPEVLQTNLNENVNTDSGNLLYDVKDENENILSASIETSPGIDDGNPHLIVVIADIANNDVTFVIDGVVRTTKYRLQNITGSLIHNLNPSIFAREQESSSNDKFLPGDLGELREYSRLLSNQEAQNLDPTNFNENARFTDVDYSDKVDGTSLQITSKTLNIPNNTTLKGKVHRTDGSDNIQESTGEIDLSQSTPIDVPDLGGSKNYAIEISMMSTSDVLETPTFDNLELAGNFFSISGTSSSEDSTSSGSISSISSISGNVSSEIATVTGTVKGPSSVIKSNLSISDSTSSGSLSNIVRASGSFQSESSTIVASLSNLAIIGGSVDSQNSTVSGQVSEVDRIVINGTTQSENSTTSGQMRVVSSISPQTVGGAIKAKKSTVQAAVNLGFFIGERLTVKETNDQITEEFVFVKKESKNIELKFVDNSGNSIDISGQTLTFRMEDLDGNEIIEIPDKDFQPRDDSNGKARMTLPKSALDTKGFYLAETKRENGSREIDKEEFTISVKDSIF